MFQQSNLNLRAAGRLILAGVAGLLSLAGCVPTQEQVADTSGRTASANPGIEFVARVVGDTEDVWDALFIAAGNPPYPKPTVVIFFGQVQSACGSVSAATGPLYCPAGRKLYLDPAFFIELSRRFDATGDFAPAYLIVHEIGHHVQNVLGAMPQSEGAVSVMEERQRNRLQLRLELQADCYTGVWAYFVQKRNLLEPRDLENGLPAALAVGDTLTHGTPAQRMWWFKQGLATGDPKQCDTVAASQP